MSKPGETTINCITVPVNDYVAKALHEWDNGQKTTEAIIVHPYVNKLCDALATLAGYEDGFYVCSELAATQYAEAEQ